VSSQHDGLRRPVAGLHIYEVALTFHRHLRQALRGRGGHVVDQAFRSAESVVRNVAEAHPATGPDRTRRFRIAAIEAWECDAALDLFELRGEINPEALRGLRRLLDRQLAMLDRLSR
jgi:four helix bundle protein